MPTELERRARELLAAELRKKGIRMVERWNDVANVTANCAIDVIAATLQAQQPINGDVESSKAAAVPSVDGGPGNYVAPASPPSQQPGAQAVATAQCPKCKAPCTTEVHQRSGDWGWGTTDVERTTFHYAGPQPPSIPEPSDEDVEKCLNAPVPGGAQVKAWLPMLDDAWTPHDTAKAVVRSILTTDRARLRERIGGGK